MENIFKQAFKMLAIFCTLILFLTAACKKDEYYQDGGLTNPLFKGNILEYLKSNPKFDTIAQIVKLANMEDVFKNEEITFFCPTDEVVRRTIGTYAKGGLNTTLFNEGKDTIQVLSDIKSEIWKKYLSRYIVKGVNKLKDYPQLDFNLKSLYPGGYYFTYNNDVVNIGVVYNSANGVIYTGYRQLSISFLQNPTNTESTISAAVASSDLQCKNGVTHVLALTLNASIGSTITNAGANSFGFGGDFTNEVLLSR
jgi:hypothetical protein